MRSPHPNFMRQLMFSFILFFTVAFVWTLIAYGMTESLLREEVESNSTAALEQLEGKRPDRICIFSLHLGRELEIRL